MYVLIQTLRILVSLFKYGNFIAYVCVIKSCSCYLRRVYLCVSVWFDICHMKNGCSLTTLNPTYALNQFYHRNPLSSTEYIAQLAGAPEYTDGFSAKR